MGWLIRVALCVLTITILPSCGGSSKGGDDESEGGACENAAACGGDVVGTWTITSSCLDIDAEQMMGSSCPGATGRATEWNATGNITFGANLTYSSTTTVSGNVIVTLPASCLTQQGITVSCAQVQDSLEANLVGSRYSSARCSISAGAGCACTLGVLPISSTESGTYSTTAAGVLTQAPAGGSSSTSAFCVQGSTMTLSPEEMAMGNTSGSITLTKQ